MTIKLVYPDNGENELQMGRLQFRVLRIGSNVKGNDIYVKLKPLHGWGDQWVRILKTNGEGDVAEVEFVDDKVAEGRREGFQGTVDPVRRGRR